MSESPREELFFTEPELAKIFECDKRTLRRWHAARIGPPRISVGKLVLYPREGFNKWLNGGGDQRIVRSRDRKRRAS